MLGRIAEFGKLPVWAGRGRSLRSARTDAKRSKQTQKSRCVAAYLNMAQAAPAFADVLLRFVFVLFFALKVLLVVRFKLLNQLHGDPKVTVARDVLIVPFPE